MTKIVLPNGNIKLTAPNGVRDTRTNLVYSEVICRPKEEKYYEEA